MEDVWNEITQSFEQYAPLVIGALIILLVGWLVAWLVSAVVRNLLHRTSIDNRVAGWLSGGEDGGAADGGGVERGISSGVFWLIILVAVISALETLELETVTQPLNDVLTSILGFLPNLIAAGIILVVGWFVATVLRRIVENVASSFGVDRAGERAGLTAGGQAPRLSNVIGLAVFALVLIPTITAALNALELPAVAGPTSAMLDDILSMLPNIFAAAFLLVIAYIVARVLSQIVGTLLAGVGFDTLPQRMGASPQQATVGASTPSQLVGYLVLVGIMFVATMEALRIIGFVLLADLVLDFLVFAGQVLFGVVIIGIGFFLAGLAARAIRTSGASQAELLSTVARVAIIVFAFAVGMSQMGIADEIVLLAFALPLAAVALGAAIALGIAFGMGGREVASQELRTVRDAVRSPDGSDGAATRAERPGATR
ncbi:MAG: mechanosensitive ion channel [Dehalococcoidia bacterium]|nr:mechanosensitive ion channel [Dehalococcoidia bacterium]